MSLVLRLLLATGLLFATDAALFHTGWYARLLEPESSAANVERLITLERTRQNAPARSGQIVAVGDSRMGFFVRHANDRHAADGYGFGTIALGGAGPRCWY